MASQDPGAASRGLSPDVSRAEQSDAEGAHGDAIDHLAAGARKNDVEAMTRLGKRLLVGDRAPCLPKEGARFVADASARGGAEAAGALAVLYAVGASQRHGVGDALESLILAAERGWPHAQAQLEVLAESPSPVDARAAASEPHVGASQLARLARLGQRIDLRRLAHRAVVDRFEHEPAGPLVSGVPRRIRCAAGSSTRARGRLSRALVYEAVRREVMARPTRTNTAAAFNLAGHGSRLRARAVADGGVPRRAVPAFRAVTVLHYDVGEEITDHYDFIDPNLPDYSSRSRSTASASSRSSST